MPFHENPGKDTCVKCNFTVSSTLQPASGHQPYQVNIDQISLTDLPGIMDNMGWDVAPKLMKKWFSGKAYNMTEDDRKFYDRHPLLIPPARYDDSIVTIAWAQNFKRFLECRDLIMANMLTPKSREVLEVRLRRLGWPATAPRLGHEGMSARELNEVCQIQTQEFGSLSNTIDDMYGALGIANVQLAVVGYVRRVFGKADVFVIEKLGLYIKDVYEFNGDQFLGVWTREKTLGKAEIVSRFIDRILAPWAAAMAGHTIEESSPIFTAWNEDFKNYRKACGKGGDFIIYSDVLWVSWPKPIMVDLGGKPQTDYSDWA